MTPEEYNDRLTKLHGLVSGNLAKDTIYPAGIALLLSIKNRIANEGKNSDGGNIGDYSTKPIYAGPKVFINGGFVAQGKNNFEGNTFGDRLIPAIRLKKTGVKKNPARYKLFTLVKPDYTTRKTMYLKDGYKELRDVQSLRTDIMNFKYSGDLLESYQAHLQGQEVLLGLTTQLSALKREGLEAKRGRVFYASDAEIAAYKSKSLFSITRITRNTIQGYDVTAEIN